MEIRAPLILSALLIAGMLATSFWAWYVLPADILVAIHFDWHGLPNGFAKRDTALLAMPLTASVITALFAAVARIGRYKERLEHSSAAYIAGWLGSVTLLFVAHCMVFLLARGTKTDFQGTHILAISMLAIVVGNFLGKSRPNPFVGVRTPWTKKSDLSWDKTNRLAGRLFVADGLAALATQAVSGAGLAGPVLFSGLLIIVALTVPLSRYYWSIDPDRQR